MPGMPVGLCGDIGFVLYKIGQEYWGLMQTLSSRVNPLKFEDV